MIPTLFGSWIANDARGHGPAQKGFTLVELMVGIVVGLIVIGGVIAVYMMVLTGSNLAIREARLNQELRVALAFITEDVRRAGFWRQAANVDFGSATMPDHPNIFANRNPDGTPIRDIAIHGGDCIMFSYDASFEGAEGQNVFGFRLENNAIQMLLDSTIATTAACSHNATWVNLSNPDVIVITGLSFDTGGSRCFNGSYNGNDPTRVEWQAPTASSEPACSSPPSGSEPQDGDLLVESRRINVTVDGHHSNDLSTNQSIQTTIKVRNNRVYRHRATP